MATSEEAKMAQDRYIEEYRANVQLWIHFDMLRQRRLANLVTTFLWDGLGH